MNEEQNINCLLLEVEWLEKIINQAIRSYLLQEGHELEWQEIPMPNLSEDSSSYADLVLSWDLNQFDRLALALAVAPQIRPEVLDVFFGKNQLYDRGFTEFGGVISHQHSGFIPTVQTYYFILGSKNPMLILEGKKVLNNQSKLIIENVLAVETPEKHLPNSCGVLSLGKQWLDYFVFGKKPSPEFSSSFPAKKISTLMEWEDVVLNEDVLEQVEDLAIWITKSSILMQDWNLRKRIKPGFRTLFYGPPGTGKTLTATLLGKATGKDVYQVDLSMIVSKYIGETEKNLAKIFDIAQHKDWILFFDEADALFGKRTAANSSNDRHANQQTSYLLQRIEAFPGIIILASNLKANMDDAFTRRFQSMIHFPMPSVEERFQLWNKAFSSLELLESDVDLYYYAEHYELTGGSIINILRNTALKAVKKEKQSISNLDIQHCIKQELFKENKTVEFESNK